MYQFKANAVLAYRRDFHSIVFCNSETKCKSKLDKITP